MDLNDFRPNDEHDEGLLRHLQANAPLINRVIAGEAIREFLFNTAAGKRLTEGLAHRINEAFAAWMSTEDPGSKEGRIAHFNARVAVSMIQELDTALQDGQQARLQIQQSDQDYNKQGNPDE